MLHGNYPSVEQARLKFYSVAPCDFHLQLVCDITYQYCFFFVGISQATGMDPHDIAATLQLLNMVQKRDGK